MMNETSYLEAMTLTSQPVAQVFAVTGGKIERRHSRKN
jgi:hypothetical protein